MIEDLWVQAPLPQNKDKAKQYQEENKQRNKIYVEYPELELWSQNFLKCLRKWALMLLGVQICTIYREQFTNEQSRQAQWRTPVIPTAQAAEAGGLTIQS